VLGGIEELKSLVGIIGRPLPLVCNNVITNVRNAKKPNFVQKSDILIEAFLEESSQSPEVIKVKDFAKIKINQSNYFIFRYN